MSSSSRTAPSLSGRSGAKYASSDAYSYSKAVSLADLSARFGSITHDSILSIRDTPNNSTPGLSFLTNQQIFKRVVEWFQVWRPWQQRMLLCGLTNKCSTNQLESLATALEPIFHRDFKISLMQRYPSASLKAKLSLPPLRKKRKAKKKRKVSSAKLGRSNPRASSRDHSPANVTSVERMSDTPEQNERTIREHISSAVRSVTNRSNLSQILPTVNDYAGPIIGQVLQETAVQIKVNSEGRKSSTHPTSSTQSLPLNSRQLLKPPGNDRRRNAANTTNLLAKSLPLQGSDMLKFEQVKNKNMSTLNPTQHHNAWSSHTVPGTSSKTTVSQDPTTHRHDISYRTIKRSGVKDFFNTDRFKVFAKYQADAPYAHLQRPDMIDDVTVPVQRFYKSQKWFSQTPRQGAVYVKPKTAHLQTHFREQMEQLWEWMERWQDFEKLHLLKRLIKVCADEEINHLAQCLYTRLLDRCGVNWLPDKLLLVIFSYLTPKDINSCAQVCRRWKYLSSVEELWMLKCHELGQLNAIPHLAHQIQINSECVDREVDWKQAYYEVKDMTNQVKALLPEPGLLPRLDGIASRDGSRTGNDSNTKFR